VRHTTFVVHYSCNLRVGEAQVYSNKVPHHISACRWIENNPGRRAKGATPVFISLGAPPAQHST
jgi:hypothetical protein